MSELMKTVVFLSICLVYGLHIYACCSVDDWGGGMSVFSVVKFEFETFFVVGRSLSPGTKKSTVMACKQ